MMHLINQSEKSFRWQNMTSKEARTIEAVIFDWDMTLAYTLQGVSRVERLTALFQREGWACTESKMRAAMDAFTADAAAGKVQLPHTPPQTHEEIVTYYQYLLDYLGFPNVSWEEANALYNAYAYLPTRLYADAVPTLRALQAAGKLLGIISNHATAARPMIERMIGDYIPAENIFISQELGIHKPAPSIFQRAMTQLGTPAEQSLFVGDNLVVDAQGAVEQGDFAHALWLDRADEEGERPLPANISRITSLSEVLDYV